MGDRNPRPRRSSVSAIKTVKLVVRISPMEGRRTKRGSYSWNPNKAFVACASFERGGGASAPKLRDACAYGRNPRQAVAGALGKAKTKIQARGGVFKGYSRKRR